MVIRVPDIPARLELSARVIDGWERLGKPMGRPEDSLRLIDQELRELDYLLRHNPEQFPAEPIRALKTRYQALANKVRMGSN